MSVEGSILIPAHNEESVIERTLSTLVPLLDDGVAQVIVSCNGCSDATAAVARRVPKVEVLETEQASKVVALRLADKRAGPGPRVYLDADIVINADAVLALFSHLSSGGIAARPPLKYLTDGSSWPVRMYFEARTRMPSVMNSLWGAGVYALSAEARARFGDFPDLFADDLWVDGLFEPHEIAILKCPPVLVRVPRGGCDLVRVLGRVYRGKAAAKSSESTGAVANDVRRLATSSMSGAILAVTYSAFAMAGRVYALLDRRAVWARDASSR